MCGGAKSFIDDPWDSLTIPKVLNLYRVYLLYFKLLQLHVRLGQTVIFVAQGRLCLHSSENCKSGLWSEMQITIGLGWKCGNLFLYNSLMWNKWQMQ